MDNLHVMLSFYLGKKDQIYYHSWKEELKISKSKIT